jgi:hypothetical protein
MAQMHMRGAWPHRDDGHDQCDCALAPASGKALKEVDDDDNIIMM